MYIGGKARDITLAAALGRIARRAENPYWLTMQLNDKIILLWWWSPLHALYHSTGSSLGFSMSLHTLRKSSSFDDYFATYFDLSNFDSSGNWWLTRMLEHDVVPAQSRQTSRRLRLRMFNHVPMCTRLAPSNFWNIPQRRLCPTGPRLQCDNPSEGTCARKGAREIMESHCELILRLVDGRAAGNFGQYRQIYCHCDHTPQIRQSHATEATSQCLSQFCCFHSGYSIEEFAAPCSGICYWAIQMALDIGKVSPSTRLADFWWSKQRPLGGFQTACIQIGTVSLVLVSCLKRFALAD